MRPRRHRKSDAYSGKMGTGIKALYNSSPFLLLLRLIRMPNLLLVALTQYIINFHVIHPGLDALSVSGQFSDFHFHLLLTVTLLITASGYLINDIHDIHADEFNKPEKRIVGKYISFATAYWLYFCCCISGYMLALYLAFYVECLAYANIYLLALGSLYVYSAYFKKKPLIGNVTVAVFCAGVAAILVLAEYDALQFSKSLNPGYYQHVVVVIGIYALFAFLSTLFREIVKDLEDVEGDKLAGYRTAPIAWGIRATRLAAFLAGIFWLISMIACWWVPAVSQVAWISLPLAFLLFLLVRAKTKQDYSRISFLCKWIMLGGLLILI